MKWCFFEMSVNCSKVAVFWTLKKRPRKLFRSSIQLYCYIYIYIYFFFTTISFLILSFLIFFLIGCHRMRPLTTAEKGQNGGEKGMGIIFLFLKEHLFYYSGFVRNFQQNFALVCKKSLKILFIVLSRKMKRCLRISVDFLIFSAIICTKTNKCSTEDGGFKWELIQLHHW